MFKHRTVNKIKKKKAEINNFKNYCFCYTCKTFFFKSFNYYHKYLSLDAHTFNLQNKSVALCRCNLLRLSKPFVLVQH